MLLLALTVGSWGTRNYLLFDTFNLTNSSVGYNLWLGNNEYTNEFMRYRLGDGATIEDFIIPKFDEKWSFLKHYSEYQKDLFFKEQAGMFVINHPLETIENVFWKIIGFWSPLRMRRGHWSDSFLKQVITLITNTPFILLSILSLINFFKYTEYKKKKWKTLLVSRQLCNVG